jgi:hypothetical protein
MATSAAQTYIARLGFQDPDRKQDRHGLACEYLFERMVELEVRPSLVKSALRNFNASIKHSLHILSQCGEYDTRYAEQEKQRLEGYKKELSLFDQTEFLSEALSQVRLGECINVPVTSQSYRSSYVNGFADVLIKIPHYGFQFLGEVKITKEPAEQVLQQINFYLSYLGNVESVYVVTDYDPGDLKRLCAGTKIKVYRLGQVFENWLAARTTPATEEL